MSVVRITSSELGRIIRNELKKMLNEQSEFDPMSGNHSGEELISAEELLQMRAEDENQMRTEGRRFSSNKRSMLVENKSGIGLIVDKLNDFQCDGDIALNPLNAYLQMNRGSTTSFSYTFTDLTFNSSSLLDIIEVFAEPQVASLAKDAARIQFSINQRKQIENLRKELDRKGFVLTNHKYNVKKVNHERKYKGVSDTYPEFKAIGISPEQFRNYAFFAANVHYNREKNALEFDYNKKGFIGPRETIYDLTIDFKIKPTLLQRLFGRK